MNPVVLLLAVLAGAPCYQDDSQVMETDDGVQQNVLLISIDETNATVDIDGELKTVAVDHLRHIRFSEVPADVTTTDDGSELPVNLRLVDGSTIIARQFSVSEGLATFRESSGSSSEQTTRQSVDTRNIEWAELVPHFDELQSQWLNIANPGERTGDLLVINRQGALDFVEGRVGDITRDTIGFTTGERSAEAPRERIDGIVYFHATGRQFVNPLARVTTVGGSILMLRRMERDGEFLLMETVCGTGFRLLPNEIVEIDFASLAFRFLGDMAPATVEWLPLMMIQSIYEEQSILNRPRFNQSFANQALEQDMPKSEPAEGSAERVAFEHGIAIKGGTRLVYRLNGEFIKLSGYVGFAPTAPQDGNVEIIVLGDGTARFRKVLKNRSDPPQTLDINIENVNRLTIQVDYHDGRNIGDTIHFCDLKVSR